MKHTYIFQNKMLNFIFDVILSDLDLYILNKYLLIPLLVLCISILLGPALQCMIYTAPCIMFWIRPYPLRGEVGGGWALEFERFLGPVKWHRADRRVPFGAQKTHTCPGTS
jgi:hypothetical protein